MRLLLLLNHEISSYIPTSSRTSDKLPLAKSIGVRRIRNAHETLEAIWCVVPKACGGNVSVSRYDSTVKCTD